MDRYQGGTRTKGKPRNDGTKIKNHYYSCGGYITRGASVCQYRAIPHHKLEQAVIDAVLDFYERYEGEAGRELLVKTVRVQTGIEALDLTSTRKQVEDDP
ncbi:MAG: zinc ribbon domain-containing protein [Phycisphaerales bacterium]|nr:zinc ribbon domain-containing protein [Phycisphaerales bacterium]